MNQLGVFHEFYYTLEQEMSRYNVDFDNEGDLTFIDLCWLEFKNHPGYNQDKEGIVTKQTELDILLIGIITPITFETYLNEKLENLRRILLGIYTSVKESALYVNYSALIEKLRGLQNLKNAIADNSHNLDEFVAYFSKMAKKNQEELGEKIKWTGLRFDGGNGNFLPVDKRVLVNQINWLDNFVIEKSDKAEMIRFLQGELPTSLIKWSGTAAQLGVFFRILQHVYTINVPLKLLLTNWFQSDSIRMQNVLMQVSTITCARQRKSRKSYCYNKHPYDKAEILKWKDEGNKNLQSANISPILSFISSLQM